MTSTTAARQRDLTLVLMLALTFSTGIVDAVGYLGLDRVFTGNMTGNVVILGMALVGGDGLPVLGPLLALVGFMAGAALGGRVLKRAGGAWTRLTTALFTLVAVVMLALAVVLLVVGTPARPLEVTVTTLLGAAMGAQAMTVGHHIFLSAGSASDEKLIGHELSHVDKNLKGLPETGHSYGAGQMLVFAPGQPVTFTANEPSIVMLLGGEPIGPRFIEWNFVSSSKERIEQAKADWRAGRMKLPDLDHDEFIPLPGDPPPGANPMS